ncbi:hypothetical protein D3C78_1493020 [compost metagenome]
MGEDEVQVTFQGMTEQDRLVVAVLVEQRDQAIDTLGELFDGEGDIFDNHCGAGFAYRADGREGVFADTPELVVDHRVFAEINLLFHRELSDGGTDMCQLFVQQRLRRGA